MIKEKQRNVHQIDWRNMKFLKSKIYLIIGRMASGKSHFISKITKNQNVNFSNSKKAATTQCQIFQNNGLKCIDSPGINDGEIKKEQIQLDIVKFLFEQEIKLSDLFLIYVQDGKLRTHEIDLSQLSFTYFLFELFDGNITLDEVQQLFQEYTSSSKFLNWTEQDIHLRTDFISQKRQQLFDARNNLSDYLQYVFTYCIIVKTKFDLELPQELETLDNCRIEYLREQIWSNVYEEKDLKAYQNYIEQQEKYLFEKIEQIIQIEIKNSEYENDPKTQNILLLGKSQVGKSSLIEQLTSIKGLRGEGKQSMTSYCQIFPVDHNNIRYRFIDTPGYEGTEQNQTNLQCLKIVTDFLNRNRITEFKILFLHNPQFNTLDNIEPILKELNIFIRQMFDIDTDHYKSDSNLINDHQWYHTLQKNYSVDQTMKKVIKVNRAQGCLSDLLICRDENGILNIKFDSNFYIGERFIGVEESVNEKQKKIMFEAINQIENISIDEKIEEIIKELDHIKIIDTEEDYIEAYMLMFKKYSTLKYISKQIQVRQRKNDNTVERLYCKRTDIILDIQSQVHVLVGKFNYNDTRISQQIDERKQKIEPEIFDLFCKECGDYLIQVEFINMESREKEFVENKMRNDIQKHFINVQFEPFLFETTSNSRNVLLSRKQLYLNLFYHLMEKFLNKQNNNNCSQKIENLAHTQLLKELALQLYFQKRYINQNSNKPHDEVVEWIQQFSNSINQLFGTGAQIFKSSQFFNIMSVQSQSIKSRRDQKLYFESYSKKSLIFLNAAKPFSEGYRSSEYTNLGAFFNELFTKSETIISQTIQTLFKEIIDDSPPKQQSMTYYQKSEFLQGKLLISNYQQIKDKHGKNMFKALKKQLKSYTSKQQAEQEKTLKKLFLPEDSNQNLKDEISRHIVLNLFCKKLQFNDNIGNTNLKEQLIAINSQIRDHEQIITMFYYSLNHQTQINAMKSNKEVLDIIKLRNQQTNNLQQLSVIELEKIRQYQCHIEQFKKHILSIECTYSQQGNYSVRLLRKGNRFSLLYKMYCYLIEQKASFLYYQQGYMISELQKNEEKKCFEIKANASFNKFQKKVEQDQLNFLKICESYCQNRYFLKLKDVREPILTYLSSKEILDFGVEYEIDLHKEAQNKHNLQEFVTDIKKYMEKEKEVYLQFDLLKRLEEFYLSYSTLSEQLLY